MRLLPPVRLWLPVLAGLVFGFVCALPSWSRDLHDWLLRQPMTVAAYDMLHFPAFMLAYLFGFISNPGEIGSAGDAFPYTVIIQWLIVGLVVSAIIHWRRSHRTHENDVA
jgi:hypothetical protein